MTKKQVLIRIFLSVTFILFLYAIIQLSRFFKKPTNLTLIKNGTIIDYDEVVGYVIRDEEIIDTSSYSGISDIIIADGNRVSKNGTIISYISKDEEKIINKISELDVKIQEALDSRQDIYPLDVKNLETSIQFNLYQALKVKSNVYEVKEYKDDINASIEKKAKIVGELSPAGSKIKELINERLSYEKELNKSKQDLKASSAGIVSYRVDKYENVLTPKSFSSLSINELEKIKTGMGQIIPINYDKVKLVNNFECYIAVVTESEKSLELSLNSTVKLRINGNEEEYIKANVEYISDEENGKRIIVFKITTNVEELLKYRKINVDIIWWSETGLKVPNNVIKYETVVDLETGREIVTLPTVTILESTYQEKAWIKIVKSTEKFSIIENYKDSELLEIGIPEEMVKNRSTIKMYDELIVN